MNLGERRLLVRQEMQDAVPHHRIQAAVGRAEVLDGRNLEGNVLDTRRVSFSLCDLDHLG